MTADTTASVDSALAEYAELTRREMERYLPPPVEDDDARLALLTREYPDRRSKGVRPALVFAACQAFGGSLREAIGPAIAIEMLHNAFLIHDDLEDESELRRGEPTLHRVHGVPMAINAGDALTVHALTPLADRSLLGSRLSQRVLDETLRMARQTVAGQGIELRWRRDNVLDLTPASYFNLVLQKTCCYTTIYPLRIGAIIGSRGSLDSSTMTALSQFGFYLGAAFQIRDDLLNLVGSEDEYGKELLGDLHEGKRTLMLIHLLTEADEADRTWVATYLASAIMDRTPAQAAHLLNLMQRYGSIDFATTWGHAIATAAHYVFNEAFAEALPSVHRDFLQAMIEYMLERSG
jgi:geranylgeranyl diphosphate synthase type II